MLLLLTIALSVLAAAPAGAPADDRPKEDRPKPKAEPPRERKPPRPVRYDLEEILAAIRVVETGGSRSGGKDAVGDGGRAIGPYQIHRPYWIDSKVPGRFEDCRDAAYAREVVLAYWSRYCPKALEALDAEVLARIHNGGPGGMRKDVTKVFWRKVEKELVKARAKRRSA